MKRFTHIVFVFFLMIASIQAGDKATDAIWIDVRTVAEYQQGHKADAINIPHTSIEQRIANVTTDKSAHIRLYCAVGIRAGRAKATLERMGYTNVFNDGGLSDVQ